MKVAESSSFRFLVERVRKRELSATVGNCYGLEMEPFQPDDSLEKKRGNLPHWTHDGRTYFVTFRLADSIPDQAMKEWSDERVDWIRCHGMEPDDFNSEQLSEEEQRDYARRFGRRFHELLDSGFGSCLLRKEVNWRVVVETLEHFERERYELGGFVVMLNHVHLLIRPKEGFELSKIMQSIKSFSARKINRNEGQSGQLWQFECYDRIVRNDRELHRYERYLAENPVKANLRESDFFYRR
jgi:putative transposase